MPHDTPPTLSAGTSRRAWDTAARALSTTRRNMAVQDWVAVGFHFLMWGRVALAPDSHDASTARRAAFSLFLVTISVLGMTRGEVLRPGPVRSLAYRLGIFVPVFLSYFELRYLLPALQPRLLDLQLLSIDQALFGVSPSVWLDQFVTPATTEWFALFYYSYFYILASYLVVSMFFDKDRQRLGEIMAGGSVVVCGAHLVYTLVPGMGPHVTLAFDHPLVGGFWWKLVASTVARSGAQLDIFPSLHTAFPTFFLLHALRHRRTSPVFAVAWPITAFFVANIILATLFLRWHWGIDILAGITLAVIAHKVGVTVSAREADRTSEGRQAVWEPFRAN
jgi:hypothetical protein